MRIRYNDQSRMENVGNEYNHDIGNDQLQVASKSFLTNDKIQLVGKLAAGVAHEIRNPLTSINGFVQLLNMGASKPEYYSIIYSEINKVEEIVNRLTSLAETQSVNFHLNNIGLILERSIMRMNDLTLLKGIKIISSLERIFYPFTVMKFNFKRSLKILSKMLLKLQLAIKNCISLVKQMNPMLIS